MTSTAQFGQSYYLYTSSSVPAELTNESVFYLANGERSAKTLCRLFSKEYPSASGNPEFFLRPAVEITPDDQILLDEAIDSLELYDDPDPYIYDPPPSGATMMRAHYARRAKEWEARISVKIHDQAGNVSGMDTGTDGDQNSSTRSGQPSAFISYSWDNESHREWVRTLATRLRTDGVNASIDRWQTVPGDQLPAFMEHAIRENQFVIIVCTPRYKKRSDAREGGVGYEGDIMSAEVMTQQNHRKFIPILRIGTWKESAPSWLAGKYHINLSAEPYSERDYEDLVRTLLGKREVVPPLGKPMSTISSPILTLESSQAAEKSEFEDIKITRVIVEGITEPRNDGSYGSALYTIPFAFSHAPSWKWEELFIANWNHPPRFTSMHRPGIASIDDSTVTLNGTTLEEVEKYHRDTLQLVVGETNRQYREWQHSQERQREREQAKHEEHRKNIEDASKRIKFN
jgi:hypothetical protein